MARHFNNPKSVQAQLDELKQVKERLQVLQDELKEYMNTNDIDTLNGLTTCYVRKWTNDTLIFDSTKFRNDNPNLYEQYKTKEKAGFYSFEPKAIK